MKKKTAIKIILCMSFILGVSLGVYWLCVFVKEKWETKSYEEREWQIKQSEHVNKCREAFEKDFAEEYPKEDYYIRWDYFNFGNVTRAAVGFEICHLIVCETEKGWSRENTYRRDSIDCSGTKGKKINFQLK